MPLSILQLYPLGQGLFDLFFARRQERRAIPSNFDFNRVPGLSREVVQRLKMLLEKYKAEGRSTPGAPQANTEAWPVPKAKAKQRAKTGRKTQKISRAAPSMLEALITSRRSIFALAGHPLRSGRSPNTVERSVCPPNIFADRKLARRLDRLHHREIVAPEDRIRGLPKLRPSLEIGLDRQPLGLGKPGWWKK